MTSQYDIESGLSKLRRLDFDIKKLKENKTPTKLEKKQIRSKEDTFKNLNTKLTTWCNEFDKRIKSLEALEICPNPDKIFVMRVPKYVTKKKLKEYIEQYEGFIKTQSYKIEGMDKQTGYISNSYTFFCKKAFTDVKENQKK